jgi:hypothetical protein
MEERDRRLYQSLVEKFFAPAAPLPNFLPHFMAFEEPARVEQRDASLEAIVFRIPAHYPRA